VSTHVVRIWIPDRPGALGAVASRIGSVKGDLIGIDILERGAGLAIDELVVVLPDEALVPLLLKEMNEVDGVAVEDIRLVASGVVPDPRLAGLESAAFLVEQTAPEDVLGALVVHVAADFEAAWAAVIDPGGGVLHAAVGDVPPPPWLIAFLAGSRSAPASVAIGPGDRPFGSAGPDGPDDIAWAQLALVGLDVVLGRPGRPVRQRERQQLSALARIADLRCSELSASAPTAQPSGEVQARDRSTARSQPA